MADSNDGDGQPFGEDATLVVDGEAVGDLDSFTWSAPDDEDDDAGDEMDAARMAAWPDTDTDVTWEGSFEFDRAELHVGDGGIETGDITFVAADRDDLPDLKLASFTTAELIKDAVDCGECDVLAADAGYTYFCTQHRLEAILTALARSGP